MNFAKVEEQILGGTTARRGDIVIKRGEGCWVFDTKGKKYLDLGSAQGVAMLGHCHPAVTEAICEQAQNAHAVPPTIYTTTSAPSLRRRWSTCCRSTCPTCFSPIAALKAVDGALKFARLVTKRAAFVSTTKGFHGRDDGGVVGDVGAENTAKGFSRCSKRCTCRTTTRRRSTRR
jgi:acetylornithine/LysW-gamma-L-lysine aminotransferase